MFVSENVPALFKKGLLKLQQTEDGYRRVAEATLVIEPFPVDLARELGEEIAGHLFTDENQIRSELEAIDLRVRVGLLSVGVRYDEQLETIALLSPVSVKDVSVQRVEDLKTQRAWLACSFVLVFSLEERAARNFVLDEFGKTLLWTFTAMQRELLAEARVMEAAARLGDLGPSTITAADPNGTVTGPIHFNAENSKKLRDTAKKLRAAAEGTKH